MKRIKCSTCSEEAEVKFNWPTSEGPKEAQFCGQCASRAWNQFQFTPAFQGIQIEELRC